MTDTDMTIALTGAANPDATVLFGEEPAGDGVLGLVVLNRPKQLNAVAVEMDKLIHQQLSSWESNDQIVGIGIVGAGDRAFCAGGDVVSIHKLLATSGESEASLAAINEFVDVEYDLLSRLYEWDAPVITIAHGICMGFGCGIASVGSHRIAGENMKIAMPENRIGLFPDVGAGWFFNKFPYGLARTLTISGVTFEETVATIGGFFTGQVANDKRAELLKGLPELPWIAGDHTANHQLLTDHFATVAPIAEVRPTLYDRFRSDFDELAKLSLQDCLERITQLAPKDPFFAAAAASVATCSPTSVVLSDLYLKKCRGNSREEVTTSDQVLLKRRFRGPDFIEGIRSAIVDKGHRPTWEAESVDEVERSTVTNWIEEALKHPI